MEFFIKEASEDKRPLQSIAKDLYNLINSASDFNILELVQALSSLLTSKHIEKRRKGTELLTHYLHQ